MFYPVVAVFHFAQSYGQLLTRNDDPHQLADDAFMAIFSGF